MRRRQRQPLNRTAATTMRPPARNDGPAAVAVPLSLRKHQPPFRPPSPSAAQASTSSASVSTPDNLQANQQHTATQSLNATFASASASATGANSSTTAANTTRTDNGRRAFFNVDTDLLLSREPATSAAAGRLGSVGGGEVYTLISYDRNFVNYIADDGGIGGDVEDGEEELDDSDECTSPQVSFSSSGGTGDIVDDGGGDDDVTSSDAVVSARPPKDKGFANTDNGGNRVGSSSVVERANMPASDDSSASANQCMLPPMVAAVKRNTNSVNSSNSSSCSSSSSRGSSSSSRSANNLKRQRSEEPAVVSAAPVTMDTTVAAIGSRMTVVKNSASLIFTKKTTQPNAVVGQLGNSLPTVHRRQPQQRANGRPANHHHVAEKRRSLHDQLLQHPDATRAAAPPVRSERAYSWYAPLYTPLREEGEYRILQNPSEPSERFHRAAAAIVASDDTSESMALLGSTASEPTSSATVATIVAASTRKSGSAVPPQTLNLKADRSSHPISMSPHGGGSFAEPQQQQQHHTSAAVTSAAGATATVAPAPKYSRFEQLIKSLVGRKVSRDSATPPAQTAAAAMSSSSSHSAASDAAATATASNTTTTSHATSQRAPSLGVTPTLIHPAIASPEIRITKSPSEYSLIGNGGGCGGIAATGERAAHMSSTASLNAVVQQKLWSVVPLLQRRDAAGSCASLSQQQQQHQRNSMGATSGSSGGAYALMKKCETVLALSRSASSQIGPTTTATATTTTTAVRPQNRLRNSSSSTITCSRCSSLLSLAANGSRYSLNVSQGGGFVPIGDADGSAMSDRIAAASREGSASLLAPLAAASSAVHCSRSSLLAAAGPIAATATATSSRATTPTTATCKLCLGEVPAAKLSVIMHCGCVFCTECMMAYVEFEILEGAYEISCPDALCPVQGALSLGEITQLSSSSLVDKHKRYRLNREVDLDKTRTWCPKAGCDTVCHVNGEQCLMPPQPIDVSVVSVQPLGMLTNGPCLVQCPTCTEQFCSGCKKTWHPSMSCEENTRQLVAEGHTENIGIPFDNDLIKCCPTCSVPIEKDEGCAQMMCKRCKHVFCWYCLASLDDDFLLRHYDRGPCKNKLGHSRASVVWHRAQVIGIFAGFGILLLVASPLLLLAAPCIVCCKCRICSGAAKLEESGADEFEEFSVNR